MGEGGEEHSMSRCYVLVVGFMLARRLSLCLFCSLCTSQLDFPSRGSLIR